MSLWRFDAIGTVWEIETEAPVDDERRTEVRSVIDAFDRSWSRFREDSAVSAISGGGAVPAPADAVAMLDLYRELSDATAGAVNPLAGDALVALGYDAGYSLVPGEPRPAPADWTRVLHWSSETLTLAEPAVIDVGALGKGRLVDRVLSVLTGAQGRIVVDAGGDLATRGGELRVALEHPYDPALAVGVAGIRDQALCASGIGRRAWGDGLHHVIDARTGLPVRRWAATWAIAADALHADAAATAVFFDGGEPFAARHGAEWARMSTDGRVESSPGFPGELFLAA